MRHLPDLAPKLNHVFEQLSSSLDAFHPDVPATLARVERQWCTTRQPATMHTAANALGRWLVWFQDAQLPGSLLSLENVTAYVRALEVAELKPRSIAAYVKLILQLAEALNPGPSDVAAYLTKVCRMKLRVGVQDHRSLHDSDILTRERLERLSGVIDPSSLHETRTMAVAWVLYDTLLAPKRIFGERVGYRWLYPTLRHEALEAEARDRGHRLVIPAGGNQLAETRCVGPEAVHWIARYHELRRPNTALFSSRLGNGLQGQTWVKDMDALLPAAGLPGLRIGLESCRRGAALDLLNAGVSPREICELAGWKTIVPILRLISVTAPRVESPAVLSREGVPGKAHRPRTRHRKLTWKRPVHGLSVADFAR